MPLADPLSRAIDLVWDEWSFLLLRSAFMGVRRFEGFLDEVPISRNRLAERLQRLVDAGLFTRQSAARYPEYRLAPGAHAMYPFIVLLLQWAHRQLGMAAPSLDLRHGGTHALDIDVICTQCRQPVAIKDVRFERNPAPLRQADEAATERTPQRRRFRQMSEVAGTEAAPLFDPELSFALDAIGDRWSVLILRSAFFGLKRFDEIQADLNIARNILTDRLERLQAHGLLLVRPYSDRPPRNEYLLTARSRALYPAILMMRAWSLQWIAQPADPWLLRHQPCGHELVVEPRCRGCGEVPNARQVMARPSGMTVSVSAAVS